MSDKVYLGQNASDLDYDEKAPKISRVNLAVDIDHIYTSGDDTGRTLEVSCPWGSQAMADSILAKVSGIEYQPYEASDALLDPATEIGDGITLGGVYSVLAQLYVSLDKQCAANISAPYTDEIDDEYPYKTPEQRKTERQLAQTRSLITKNAEEIKLEVQGLDGKYTKLSQTVNGFTFEDESGTVYIDGGAIKAKSVTADQIDATNLKVAAANITGTLSASQVQIDLTGSITWADLSSDVKNEINDATSVANAAQTAASNAENTVDGWRYGSTTYIDSSMIKVTTLMATELLGGSVGLLTDAEKTAGGIEITGASTSTYAIELYSNGALRLGGYNGAVYIEGYGNTYITIDKSGPYSEYSVVTNGDFLPNGTVYLGRTGYEWAGAYLDADPIITSDANRKHDIEELPEKYVAMFDLIEPKRFKLNDGTSGRYHVGYIAQEVKAAMDATGVDSTEFGGWVRDIDSFGREIYSLRYGEFWPICAAKLKQLEARVAALEGN